MSASACTDLHCNRPHARIDADKQWIDVENLVKNKSMMSVTKYAISDRTFNTKRSWIAPSTQQTVNDRARQPYEHHRHSISIVAIFGSSHTADANDIDRPLQR